MIVLKKPKFFQENSTGIEKRFIFTLLSLSTSVDATMI